MTHRAGKTLKLVLHSIAHNSTVVGVNITDSIELRLWTSRLNPRYRCGHACTFSVIVFVCVFVCVCVPWTDLDEVFTVDGLGHSIKLGKNRVDFKHSACDGLARR